MRKPRIVFLKIIFLTIILIVCSNAKAQLFIGSKEDFTANPQKDDHAYTIYWYPFSDYMLKHLHIHEKTIIEKGEVENGLIKSRIKYFSLEIVSTEESFYKNTLLIKYIRKFGGAKFAEIYHYKYDAVTNQRILSIGIQNGKLIYRNRKSRVKDSIIDENFSESLGKHKTIAYFSKDSLKQTDISYNNGNQSFYNIKRFNSKRLLLEEIDSSNDNVESVKYFYDATGRLSEKRSYRNSEPQNITEYKYERYKTTISTYPFYKGKKGEIEDEDLQVYDKNGLLVFEKATEYDKPEGIVAPPGSKQILLEPIVEPGLIIMKSYHQNRLVQVQINHGDEIGNCYEIKYR